MIDRQHSSNSAHQIGMLTRRFACFALLTLAVGCASTHRQEGTGEYVDDSVITGKVKALVFNEPGLKSTEINVETFKGAVQMSGFVESQPDIDKAVALARGVQGVTSVKNDMRVKGTQ
jgi:osmotically-inducible protein OsmY